MIALKLYSPSAETEPPANQLSLRGYYQKEVLPEIRYEQAASSLEQDEIALRHWERYTTNPPIVEIGKEHIAMFRDGLIARGLANSTVNKYWRELRAVFNWAQDEAVISRTPVISKRSKSKLLKEPSKRQRETLTIDEVTRLYKACSKATYPDGGETPAPKLWRTAVVLWWFYGARTMDLLKHLEWSNVLWNDRLLRFAAQKTGKLQGLPLTDLTAAHLKSIMKKSNRVFPGFNTKGSRLHSGWKRGFYTSWRAEIQPEAGLSGIDIRHFRETMVTRNNGIEAGLGNWIAGHYMPGVSAQNYDLPTQRVRDAVDRTPVPECFNEID